jgi:phage-related protein
MAGEFEIAKGELVIEADTDAAKREMQGFFRDINGKLRDTRGRFASEGEKSGKEFSDGLERGIGRGGFFSNLFKGIGSGISGGIGQLRDLGSTLRDVGQVFSTAGGFIGSALKIGAFAAAIPIVVGLAAALSKLIGLLALLPGVVGFAVTAIAPLIVGFQGMGDALGALMSGDMEKLNEALKKLAPSARAFVKEFGQILPMLRAIKRDTQQALFAPMLGGLKELGKFTLPTIRAGMTEVAGAMGRMLRGFMDLFAAKDIVEAIGDIFESTGRIIDRVAPSLTNLLGTLIGVAEHGLPFVERMFGNMANGLDRFAKFLGDAMADGRLEKWLEDAFSVMNDLWQLTQSLVRLFGALFGPTADEGQTFIQSMTMMIDKLTEFFRSDEGIEFLENLVAILRVSATWLGAIAKAMIFLMEANNSMIDGIAAIVGWFRNLDDVISGWLSGAGAAISEWWNSAVDAIGRLGTAIGTFVAEKAAAFGQWLINLPAMIKNGLLAAGNMIAEGIGFAVGRGIRFVLDMPERMQAGWEMFKTRAIESINAIVAFFGSLPERVGAQMAATWAAVTGWFTRTRDDSTSRVREMFNSAVSFATELGPRIIRAVGSAFNWLREAGRDAIRGLVEGIKDMLGWLIDRAKSIGESIVKGFKRGLGIASPSKVMRDQVGKWLIPGIVAGMESSMGSLDRFMGDVQRRITNPMVHVASPAVAVGGPTVLVDLGDGVRRAVRTVVTREPQIIAAGTDEGRRQRARELGTRAKA